MLTSLVSGILVILPFLIRPLLSQAPPDILPLNGTISTATTMLPYSNFDRNNSETSINVGSIVSGSEFDKDITYLSGLPMEKLLKIKKQLETISTSSTAASSDDQMQSNSEFREGTWLRPIFETDTDEGQIYASDSGFLPMQSQLNGQVQINYHNPTHDPHAYITPQPYTVTDGIKKSAHDIWAEEKPSKIQTIFQASITALAFLAFAGYLLCMIVTAGKSHEYMYVSSSSLIQAAVPGKAPQVELTVPIKKRKPSYGRRRRRRSIQSNDNNNTYANDDDDMFHAMTTLAEGYVKFSDNIYLAAS